MSQTKNILRFLTVAVLTTSALTLTPALSAEEKKRTEKDVVTDFISTVTRLDTMTTKQHTFDDAAVNMDFDEMARRAFGEVGWATFSSAEQKEVAQLFRKLMQNRYFARWRRVFSAGKYEIKSISKDGKFAKDSIVRGTLHLSGKKSDVNFQLFLTGDGPRIISMVVSDKDLLERTSVRLKRALRRKGAAGLIAYLRTRLREPEANFNQVPSPAELISGSK